MVAAVTRHWPFRLPLVYLGATWAMVNVDFSEPVMPVYRPVPWERVKSAVKVPLTVHCGESFEGRPFSWLSAARNVP